MKFLRRSERPTQSYQIPEKSKSMTNMARKVWTRVVEAAVVVVPISALTSSRAEDVEDLASSRPTTFSDSSSEVEIHLLISLTMIPS